MRSAALFALASAFLLLAAGSGVAVAQPIPGFVEDFNDAVGDLGDFGGGADLTNPGTNGVDGSSDGFLRVARATSDKFGTRADSGSLTGDYVTAEITHVRFWLNDVDADQAFEITFLIGTQANLWRFNTPFIPPENSWTQFEVDLRSSANFTQSRGSGTYEDALAVVSRFLFRHDLAPYTQIPNSIAGELGIDKIELVATSAVDPGTWGQIKTLFR
jgi:hypothetical protein